MCRMHKFRTITFLLAILLHLSACSGSIPVWSVSPIESNALASTQIHTRKLKLANRLDDVQEIVSSSLKQNLTTSVGDPLKVEINTEVSKFIVHYSEIDTQTLDQAVSRRTQHIELIERILAQHGLPIELANIVIIESGARADARGDGVAGLWQLTPDTARRYGLVVNFFKDERFDVERSTHAAALLLLELHKKFNDWNLVLAAYNCGKGRVGRAIEESGIRDFFELAARGKVSRITSEFVPRFLAVTAILRERKRYGVS